MGGDDPDCHLAELVGYCLSSCVHRGGQVIKGVIVND